MLINPSIPFGLRLYVLGDIHGRSDLLRTLLEIITADAAQHQDQQARLVCLGDYIDRGEDSKGVIEILSTQAPFLMETVCLRGNHDEGMRKFLNGDFSTAKDWFFYGGLAALASYGVNAYNMALREDLPALHSALVEKVPPHHRQFLEDLLPHYECGDYYFVHAGVRPGLALANQNERDKFWIRNEFLSSSEDFGKIIVHGHTITDEPEIRPNRIGIDTGAYATGLLTCLVLHDNQRSFLTT